MAPKRERAREVWVKVAALAFDDDRRRAVAEEIGLSFGRVRALRRLAGEPLTLGQLADRLATDPPNVTVIVDELERRGFAERRPHPTDRRAKLVALTRSGAVAAARASSMLEEPPQALIDLPADDLATLSRILGGLEIESQAGEGEEAVERPGSLSGQ